MYLLYDFIKKNIFWNSVRVGSNLVFPLVTFPYVSRVLGPDTIGLLNKNSKFEGKSEFKVLDIGCGYGVVSVVMKAFYKGITLVSSDVNERALELTTENLEKYHAKNFEVVKSFAFDEIKENFDVVLSNPPIRAGKETIFKIYAQAYEHLNENGEFYCVIQTKHGAKSTQKKLEEIFGNCETVTIDGGYRIYRSKKEKI